MYVKLAHFNCTFDFLQHCE